MPPLLVEVPPLELDELDELDELELELLDEDPEVDVVPPKLVLPPELVEVDELELPLDEVLVVPPDELELDEEEPELDEEELPPKLLEPPELPELLLEDEPELDDELLPPKLLEPPELPPELLLDEEPELDDELDEPPEVPPELPLSPPDEELLDEDEPELEDEELPPKLLEPPELAPPDEDDEELEDELEEDELVELLKLPELPPLVAPPELAPPELEPPEDEDELLEEELDEDEELDEPPEPPLVLPPPLGLLARIGQAFRPMAALLPGGRTRRDFWSGYYFDRGPKALADSGEAGVQTGLRTLLADHLTAQDWDGHVALVGAGPGDPDLLTLKARKALDAADVVILKKSFADLPLLLRVASMTRHLSQQNFVIAALYNCIAVPIALAGFATPLAAALAMSASSITVLLNAQRMRLVS